MTRTLTKTTLLLCLASSWIAVQAAPITIPLVDGDFNTVYKPGSTTVTAQSFGWGTTNAVGTNVTVNTGWGHALFSDGTTSSTVDVPGWVSGGESIVGIRQAGENYSFSAYKNGEWGGGGAGAGTLTQTLTGIQALPGTYTLSAVASGNLANDQVDLQLWAGNTQIAATNPDPVTLGAAFTDIFISKDFPVSGTLPQGDLKVVIWMRSGVQVRVDDVVLTRVPEPATLSMLGMGLLGLLGNRRRR